jgi:hypothetical protein
MDFLSQLLGQAGAYPDYSQQQMNALVAQQAAQQNAMGLFASQNAAGAFLSQLMRVAPPTCSCSTLLPEDRPFILRAHRELGFDSCLWCNLPLPSADHSE